MRRRFPRRSPPCFVSPIVDFFDQSNLRLLRASIDNIRLWNVAEVGEFDRKVKSGVQFKIIAGHHGGFVSQMRVSYILVFLSALILTPFPSRRSGSPFSHNRVWEPGMARGINTNRLCPRDKVYLLTFIADSHSRLLFSRSDRRGFHPQSPKV